MRSAPEDPRETVKEETFDGPRGPPACYQKRDRRVEMDGCDSFEEGKLKLIAWSQQFQAYKSFKLVLV